MSARDYLSRAIATGEPQPTNDAAAEFTRYMEERYGPILPPPSELIDEPGDDWIAQRVRPTGGDTWDRNTDLHDFPASRDADRGFLALVVTACIIGAAVVVSVIGMLPHVATLLYWLRH